MKIAIIGFGKLGQKIAELIEQDDTLQLAIRINSKNTTDLNLEKFQNIDVAIELSGPDHAYANLTRLAEYKVNTVCGSTGWTDKLSEIESKFKETETGFLYASNFSLGMNIFFEINERLAQIMTEQTFTASIQEVHHIHKLDSPSGTSLSIANGLIKNHQQYSGWKLKGEAPNDHEIEIESERKGEVKGDHTVTYTSKYETLSMKHSALDRTVFAEGALTASKWIKDKSGLFRMKDVIGL